MNLLFVSNTLYLYSSHLKIQSHYSKSSFVMLDARLYCLALIEHGLEIDQLDSKRPIDFESINISRSINK